MQDQALVQQQNLWLDHMTFLTSLRDALGAATVIQALYATAEKEWANMFDVNDPDTHLIKGVFVSSRKTDVVRVYISKLVAQYMRCVGVRATAWSKATIANDNDTNVAITNRIGAIEFQTNYDLFKIVTTRLMGFDDSLVDLAVIDDVKEQARHLVAFMAQRFDMADNFEDALGKYPSAVMYFEDLLDGKLLNSAYFDRLALNIANYPHQDVKPDFLDMLEIFDKHWIDVTIDEADPDPALTINELVKQGYESISITNPDGSHYVHKGGVITRIPTKEERRARFVLEQLTGIAPGPDIDCFAELAQARKLYIAGAKATQFHGEAGIADSLRTGSLSLKGRFADVVSDDEKEKVRRMETYFAAAPENRAKFYEANPDLQVLLDDTELTVAEVVRGAFLTNRGINWLE